MPKGSLPGCHEMDGFGLISVYQRRALSLLYKLPITGCDFELLFIVPCRYVHYPAKTPRVVSGQEPQGVGTARADRFWRTL